MSNPAIDQLLAWMKDKSRTYGWGALVAYDRRKTNDLLQQLYIERFTSGHYLPLINQSIESGTHIIEHVSGLKLSVPRMSFESADLNASRVTLTMDFIGGMIVTEERGLGISKIQKVLPLNSPQLSMVQPLERVSGEVDEDGVVALDIANRQGTDYKATFVLGSLEQAEVGRRFQVYFEENLSDEQKVFPLGTLAGASNGALTPEGFQIRTMAAPGAKMRGAANEGDGAVLVFARMKGHTGGTTPGEDFMYPIPADADGKEYTGTMWLSSRMLMEDLIRKDAESDIGYGITFAPYDGSTNVACVLDATAGGLEFPQLEVTLDVDEGIIQSVYVRADWNYMFKSEGAGNSPLVITPKDNHVDLSWKCAFSTYYAYKRRIEDWWDDYHEGHMACTSDVHIAMAPVLDGNGVVHFQASKRSTTLHFKSDRELPHLTDEQYNGTDLLNHAMHERIFPHFDKALGSISLPSIDTFLVRNLLFPGQNALQLTDVYAPGDLNLLGHIDPVRTTAIIAPRQATIEAGDSQQFSLGPNVSGVTWSVRGTDPDDEQVGSVNASGLYKAPAAGTLPKGYLVAVVTGSGTLDGQAVMSSAMVTVLASTVGVNPVFHFCQAGNSVDFSAEAIGGGEPLWSLKDPALGGSLSTGKGAECTYTAAAIDSSRGMIFLDTVLAGNPGGEARAEAQVLVRNTNGLMQIAISEDSDPATGQVQLQIIEAGKPYNPDDYGATCEILIGAGTLSPSGVYKQPANASGFAVIAMTYKDPFASSAGAIVLPLPLNLYEDINRRVSRSIRGTATG